MKLQIMFCLLILLCACISVLADPPKEPCKVTDTACLTGLAKDFYISLFKDNNGLDPLHHDLIEGNLAVLKYKLSDNTIKGFKNCSVENFTSDFEKLTVQIEFLCPHLIMDGKYDLKGQLLTLPVEGNGNYIVESLKYRIILNVNMEHQSNEGKTVFGVKSFTFDAEPLELVKFKFDNLFKGNKELADAVHKLAQNNWKLIAIQFQKPVFKADMNKVIEVAKKYLKTMPVEEYITFS